MAQLTEREEQILKILMDEPMLSQEKLADKLNISRAAVAVHISNLIKKGYILGRGYVFNAYKKVVVVGGANYDLIGSSNNPIKIKTSNPGVITTSIGGVGRNISEVLAKLKVPTTLLSAVGKDGHGESILKRTKEAGVDINQILITDKYPSGTYLAILDEKNDLGLALADMKIVDLVDRGYIKENISTLHNAKMVVSDTNVPLETLELLADYCREKDSLFIVEPVSVDKSKKIQGLLGKIDILTPNKEEMEDICGFKLETLEDYERAGNFAISKGIKILLLKLGSMGLYIHSKEAKGIFPSKAEKIIDVTGAGDSLVGGFIAAYFYGYDLKKCCEYALASAAYTLRFIDTVAHDLCWAKLHNILGEE